LDTMVEMLTQWVTAVKLRNAVNYTDINRIAENLALRLLNTVYNYNLENLNWDLSNYPAVDLGDDKRGISFQVTASGTLDKIKETLRKFYAPKGPHEDFPGGLYFFFINEKPPALRAETKRELKSKYGFDMDSADGHMVSIAELLKQIERLYSTDRQRFDKVKEILEEEFGYVEGKISRRHVLEELYCGSRRYLTSLRGGGGRFRYLKISDTLLAPTRYHQRKEWLDTPVVVDGHKTNQEGNSKIVASVLKAMPEFWLGKCRHALLKGEGGMGKTVSFIRLWEQYTAEDYYIPLLPVPVFIPLNEYNETDESERKGFIQRQIRRFYLDTKSQSIDLLNVFGKSSKRGENSVPLVLLLLDGLNEVTVERTGLLVELREIIEHWQGVQLLVSSRPDVRDTMGWTDFHLLELVGLGKEQIDQYLGGWGLSPLAKAGNEGEYGLRRLLQNPMMLTIYAASCEVVKEHSEISQYDFKARVETPGELLWNFMEAQAVKYVRHSGREERQVCFYKFLLKMLLPAMGYEMEKEGRFQFTGDELDAIVQRYLLRFCQADFLRTFREYRKHIPTWNVNGCKLNNVLGKVESVLDILSGEMSMLVKEGQSYRFLHQDFRDFFAAVHILNEVAIGLSRNEVADVLAGGMISFFPRRFMGEIEGEHYCKPYLEEGKGWHVKSNESALLARALELCRGNFGESYAYSVSNILESWKLLREEWSGLDLSQLDLSKVLLNSTVCSRLYKKTYLSTRFDESLIPDKSLFPEGHSGHVESAVYSPDGKKILTASSDKTIKEWDMATGTCLWTYRGDDYIFNSAVYSADGQKILSASRDGTIKEWDVGRGICLKTYEGHRLNVNSAVYSADGRRILSASSDGTIKEWDVGQGICLKTYEGHHYGVKCAVYSSDGQEIFFAPYDGTIKRWDARNVRSFFPYQEDEYEDGYEGEYEDEDEDEDEYEDRGFFTSIVYSADGQKILSASSDGTITEWDVASGDSLQIYEGHTHTVNSAVYSGGGQKILSASSDGTIKEWDVASGICLRTYQGHTGGVNSAVYSADGRKILSASRDKTIKEWDVATGTCLRTYQGYEDVVMRAVYSTDGQKILSTSSDKTIKEWDVGRGTCLRIYQEHTGPVKSAVYSTDGRKILSASSDKTIKEWDVISGTCVRTYQDYREDLTSAVYSADSQKILSFSASGIEEWDVGTGICIKTWEKKNEAPLDHYPDFPPNKIFENRLIKEENPIKIIDRQTKQAIHTFENIPGLFIQGCSFKNLHPQSQLTDEEKRLLKMYGGMLSGK